jgi:hypothetical protein
MSKNQDSFLRKHGELSQTTKVDPGTRKDEKHNKSG